MPVLSQERIGELLGVYYASTSKLLLDQLSTYLDMLLKWNVKTNLTSIRDPEEIVRRHFGESLFTALHLPPCTTLLDFGSGAGFPGLPIQLALPGLHVTLAESQNKKASFLREVVRTLGLETEVWSERVEKMPVERCFDVVALRAVDNPAATVQQARTRLNPGGKIAYLTTVADSSRLSSEVVGTVPIPGATRSFLQIFS